MKIAIISAWDEAFAPIAALSIPNRQEYCSRHGYQLITTLMPSGLGHWMKVPALRQEFDNFDWVVWIDVDALIMEPKICLEQFLPRDLGTCDLIGSHDWCGWNSGVLFFRTSDWSRRFLDKMWEAKPRFAPYPNSEQTTLVYLLYGEAKDKWECLPQRRFNSYDYGLYGLSFPEGQYQPGDFILHLPALSLERRLQIMRDFSN